MTTGSLFWPIVIAGSGGVFVLIGLLMEMFAEKPWHKNLSDFRRSKCINLCGEWLVIIGICTEIYVAADAAIKERKTETAIAKNDPMNRPVENISCS